MIWKAYLENGAFFTGPDAPEKFEGGVALLRCGEVYGCCGVEREAGSGKEKDDDVREGACGWDGVDEGCLGGCCERGERRSVANFFGGFFVLLLLGEGGVVWRSRYMCA